LLAAALQLDESINWNQHRYILLLIWVKSTGTTTLSLLSAAATAAFDRDRPIDRSIEASIFFD